MTERKRAEQLPLVLPSAESMGRDDFLEAPSNAVALAAVEAERGLPNGLTVLVGPPGSGKTHLAHIWAARTGALWQPAETLTARLEQLVQPGAPDRIVIDDAHLLAGGDGEEALFHLINHLRGRGELLLSAPMPVRDWGLRLPDLTSRLSAAAHQSLGEPEDALLAAVLVKLFTDRQVRIDPGLIDYILPRMERSLDAARSLVAEVDLRALQLKKKITAGMVREALSKDLDNDPDADAS